MVLDIITDWYCPNCDHTRRTQTAVKHQVIHTCPGLAYLVAPLVRVGTKCKIEAIEREDYVAHDHPQVDGNGRVIMAVRTTRDDGIDCRVLAPTAMGGGRSGVERF